MPSGEGHSELIKYCNCLLLRDHNLICDDLWVRDGKILDPRLVFFDEKISADVQVDCGGSIIAPGFIDTQCNGAFGVDFSDINSDLSNKITKVTRGLLAHGVTSFCPTIITSPPEHYDKLVSQIKKRPGGRHGTGILGLHLEGPFINKEKKGAHPEQYIEEPLNGLEDFLDMYGELSDTVIVTLAPELRGAMKSIRQLNNMGIVVSLGHSMADLSTGEEAVENGASLITHLFNAMLPFHHRDPHLVGLLASDRVPPERRVYYGMISDGVHSNGAAIRIAHKTHPKGLIVVTDAVPAMGLSAGVHQIGVQEVQITEDGRALIAGTNTLCGSIATMAQCVQFFRKATGCSLVEALETATLHPAQMLGITHQKGTLDYNTDADFILLDKQLEVQATYIAGERVWSNKT